jgi:FKBP-type peptidyl-prolyl cis-trans isomerase
MRNLAAPLAAIALLGAAASLAAAAAAQDAAQAAAKPESLEDRASYVIGLNLGRNLKQQSVPANTELIIKGLRDGLSGATPVLADAEMQAAMQEFQAMLMARQEEAAKVAGAANQKAADEFLATNKAKAGVVTTASGLQYEVLKAGTGTKPKPTDKVTVHYTGTLLDGTKFDSSVDRGEPATFVLNQVIPGWTEALQLMGVGAKHKIYIPGQLGYGERGAPGGRIGPNSLLVFEVELLSVESEQPPPAPAATPAPSPTPTPTPTP